MSIKVMSVVWEHSTHKEGTLVVLLALADCAHDDGTGAFPSVETLGKKARMSERNVQYCLRRLIDSGEIEHTGKHGKGTNIYRVCIEKWGANIAGANIAGVQVTTSVGCNLRQFGVKPVAPKPSIEPLVEPSLPPVVPQTKKTPMTADWQPSESSVAYAVEWGIPSELVSEVIDDFRGYWLNRPREKRPGWDLTFKNRVRDVADQYRRRSRASPNGSNGHHPEQRRPGVPRFETIAHRYEKGGGG